MVFTKYQHVERIGSDETEGRLDGTCHTFPNMDGSNMCAYSKGGELRTMSHNRVIEPPEPFAVFARGCGEGIVVKRYGFQNMFGHTVWAKVLNSAFFTFGRTGPDVEGDNVEKKIADRYVTKDLVEKEWSRMAAESPIGAGWSRDS